MARLFAALDLAEPQRTALAALIDAAASGASLPRLPHARWTPAPQLHVTLRFFGSVPDPEIGALRAALAEVRARPFELALAGVGIFPPASTGKPARVLWAKVAPVDPVCALKAAIDTVLGPDPQSAGRPFTPHVTLARLQGNRPPAPGSPLHHFVEQNAALVSPPWPVANFCLYESKTLARGPVYQVIEVCPLRGP